MTNPAAPDHALPLLVGRERERASLRDHLTAALVGHGGLVLIGGEAGIGKTALAESLCHAATNRGALVLVGRCYDLTETPPYGPWVELFGRYQSGDGPPLPIAFAQRGTVGEVTSQAALFQQVQDFLIALATRQPLVLLLDDLHWADPASLDLLRFLARSLADRPLLIVVTYRSDELTRRHPLYALLPALVREAHAERLDVRPLTENDLRELIATRYRLGPADTARLIAYLHTRAEGNPFFLGELLRTLEEEGALRSTDDGWALGDLTRVRVPPLLRQVIDGRLARLGEEAQHLLGVAAMIGQDVPLALWSTVTETDDDALLPVIERTVEAHLLAETPDETQVRFVHALIREALYEGMLATRRRTLHRRIGDTLAAMPDADPDAVAYHYQRAGDAQAREWLVTAGGRAERAYAFLTAAERYIAAATLAADANAPSRGWLLHRAARMWRFTDPVRALMLVDEAIRIARTSADRTLAAFAEYSRGLLLGLSNQCREGVAALAAGADAIVALSPEDLAKIGELPGQVTIDGDAPHAEVIFWMAMTGQCSDALSFAQRWGIADTEGTCEDADASIWADGWMGIAYAHAAQGYPELAHTAFARARAAFAHQQNHYMFGTAILYELMYHTLPFAADRVAERGRMVDAMIAAYHRASGAWTVEADVLGVVLHYVEARWHDESFAYVAQVPASDHIQIGDSRGFLGMRDRAQGKYSEAWEQVRRSRYRGVAPEFGDAHLFRELAVQRLAVALALDTGDMADARADLGVYDRWLERSGAILGQAEGQTLWAQYYRQAGEAARANTHAERALAHATEPRQPLALLAAHRLLGELHTDAHRFESARQHLDASLTLADACAAPYERALTLLAMAELYVALHERAEATTLLDEVRAVCTPLDAKPTLARVDALTAHLSAAPASPTTYPDGLSAREVDVLRLIATGLNNQEIADTLSLSVRTVERHITNLYGKIAARGRADATTYALRYLS